jgi:hypothetical protein
MQSQLVIKSCSVRALIPTKVRPVVRFGDFLSKDGCNKPSASFNEYAFSVLNNDTISRDEFNACGYIPQLQVALNYTSNSTEAASSFADLVVLPNDLQNRLNSLWGNETDFSGKFLLDNFGGLSVSGTYWTLAIILTHTR